MRKYILCLVGVALITTPSLAKAMTVQLYDFRAGQVNASWSGLGPISMEQRSEGIILKVGNESGAIITDAEPPFRVDMGSVVAKSDSDVPALFIWAHASDGDTTYSVPVAIDSESESPALFSIGKKQYWNTGAKKFGLLFPPNTTVLLQSMTLAKVTPLEKLLSTIHSFWTFDEYRPYSINFVWGPVLGNNPAEQELLYRHLPPQFPMGMWVTNLFLAGLCIAGAVLYKLRRSRRVLQITMGAFLVLWLLLDARMGSEFLSWVIHDQKTYIGSPVGTREFREREKFYDFADFVIPLIQDRKRYIFLAEYPWPYLGNMRYLTYPILPAFNLKEDDTWVIYNRSDIGINEQRQLVVGGVAVSMPGTVLGEFERGSFVFRGKPYVDPPKQ